MKRTLLRLAFGAFVIGVFLGVQPQAGQIRDPRATFRARTDLIPVDVSVLDNNRRPVRGLTAADFTVLENGRPRPVVAFSAIEIPASTPAAVDGAAPSWSSETREDVVSNDLPAEGRLVSILFDRSIPAGAAVDVAKSIAREAVQQLGPGDLAAVVRTSRFTGDGRVQGFTADRRLLLEAVESPFVGMTSAELNPSPVPGMDPPTVDCHCGLCVFEAIGQVAASMRDAPRRRKSLLFIGSAITIQIPVSTDRCFPVVRRPRERMMRELETANVTVHTIDPAGPITTNLTAAYIVKQNESPLARAQKPATYNQENARRLENLRVLPAHTGGRLVANTNEPVKFVPAIFDESRSYYLLGFEPTAPANGSSHRIEVKVNRRGTTVQARRAFVVEPPAAEFATLEPDKALVAALEAPMARRDIPLSVGVVSFPRVSLEQAIVAVLVSATLTPAPGPRRLTVAAAAFDAEGAPVVSQRQQVEVTGDLVDAGTADRLLVRLPLVPGRYELRVAVQDSATAATGSVFSFVDVPRFRDMPLAMSGILLDRTDRAPMPGDPMRDILAFTPTIARRFRVSDEIAAFTRVFTEAPGPVSVALRVLDAQGVSRFENAAELSPMPNPLRSADYSVRIPLMSLTPGQYLLRIESRAGGQEARQETQFVVLLAR